MSEDRRRSRRIVARVPLVVQPVTPAVDVLTGVINLHGALLLTPVPYPVGTALELNNRETGKATRGRVVWLTEDSSGTHKIGVEFDEVVPDFWGKSYDPEGE